MQYFTQLKPVGRKGRQPRWPQDVVEQLEQAVNDKAARCEASDGSMAERILLARQYRKLNSSQVARFMDVSREAVRLWCAGLAVPNELGRLASVLDVPCTWLEIGGEKHLPSDSHLGVRVGFESMAARDQLYGLTLTVLAEAEHNSGDESLMADMEQTVFKSKGMADLARKAGGRWHFHRGELAFVPWVSIVPHGLTRRYWSDEVETIISSTMASRRSVYSAWQEVRRNCEALDLRFPTLICLHKRLATNKERSRRFGINLNGLIACATEEAR